MMFTIRRLKRRLRSAGHGNVKVSKLYRRIHCRYKPFIYNFFFPDTSSKRSDDLPELRWYADGKMKSKDWWSVVEPRGRSFGLAGIWFCYHDQRVELIDCSYAFQIYTSARGPRQLTAVHVTPKADLDQVMAHLAQELANPPTLKRRDRPQRACRL